MPERSLQSIELEYGDAQRLRLDVPAERIVALRRAPAPLDDPAGAIADALQDPLDFPPLRRSVFPGDRIAVVLDRDLPAPETVVAGIWREFETAGVCAADVLLLHPADRLEGRPDDPRRELPEGIAGQIAWSVHSFEAEDGCGYLASSAGGERVYLSRKVIDADVVITAGLARFDPVIGYRGTNSVLYPGLSNEEAARRAQGIGHQELGPEDERPLRSLIDEIGWLLGTQFTLQTLPAGRGGIANVLAGASESVFRTARRIITQQWMVRLPTRCELAVVAIDGRAAGDDWGKLGSALDAARNIVARRGRIVVLSNLQAEPGEGLEILRDAREPSEALKPLQSFAPPDLVPASQVAAAADWASVYLLSRLPDDLVEELFLIPLEDERGAQRLLAGDESCALLESAQFAAGRVGH